MPYGATSSRRVDCACFDPPARCTSNLIIIIIVIVIIVIVIVIVVIVITPLDTISPAVSQSASPSSVPHSTKP